MPPNICMGMRNLMPIKKYTSTSAVPCFQTPQFAFPHMTRPNLRHNAYATRNWGKPYSNDISLPFSASEDKIRQGKGQKGFTLWLWTKEHNIAQASFRKLNTHSEINLTISDYAGKSTHYAWHDEETAREKSRADADRLCNSIL